MNMEASPAPETGNGIETPSTPAHWIEDVIPEDAAIDVDGHNVPLREHPSLREFKSPADMARSLLHARSLVGRKTIGLTPPSEDATDEEQAAFDAQLRKMVGVPEAPEGYELDMPEGVEADGTFVDWFRASAHELGLSPQQAQGLADRYNALVSQFAEGDEAMAGARREQTGQQLRQLWGEQTDRNLDVARRGFGRVAEQAGLTQDEARGVLDAFGDNAAMVRLFHSVGMAFTEDTWAAGNGGPQGRRPTMSTERFFAEEVFGG
ncbi:hypothetical protein JCM16814_23950 [Desulfobaculum senezii]|jgi:hypothetical protein